MRAPSPTLDATTRLALDQLLAWFKRDGSPWIKE